MLIFADAAIRAIIAYLLGSLLGSLIVGKLRGGIDIRKLGSGNAGGTNALRTQGIWFALCVMIIDVGKGWLAVAAVPYLPLNFIFPPSPQYEWLPLICAAAVALGHVFPIWFGFRGGKGAATLIGVVIALQPAAALVLMIVWLLALMTTGYVGFATILAAIAFPIYAACMQENSLLLFGIAMALFVLFTHRSNVARMRAGTENRSKRLWLLRPR